jgi:hypothetical protein
MVYLLKIFNKRGKGLDSKRLRNFMILQKCPAPLPECDRCRDVRIRAIDPSGLREVFAERSEGRLSMSAIDDSAQAQAVRKTLQPVVDEPKSIKFIRRLFGAPSNTEIATTITKGGIKRITGEPSVSEGKLIVPVEEDGTKKAGSEETPLADVSFVTFLRSPDGPADVEVLVFVKQGPLQSVGKYVGTIDFNDPNFTKFEELAKKWSIGVTKEFREAPPSKEATPSV